MPFPPTPTPITCPACRAQITVPLRQIVDVSQEPALKNALLSGRLNAFTCPVCHNSAALASPFLYHDANKELAFVFLPMQLGLKRRRSAAHHRAVQQSIDGAASAGKTQSLPAHTQAVLYTAKPARRGAGSGRHHQRDARCAATPSLSCCNRWLETTDNAAQQTLIRERAAEIDVTFFQMISAALASAQASQDQEGFAQLHAAPQQFAGTDSPRPKGQNPASDARGIPGQARPRHAVGAAHPSARCRDARVVADLWPSAAGLSILPGAHGQD